MNPARYAEQYRGREGEWEPDAYAEAIVDKAEELDIEILAITDHHSVEGISHFVRAASGRNVTIFPGFEITTSENVHLLCIFAPGRPVDDLVPVLGHLGVTSPGASARPVQDTCLEVMRRAHKHGALVIAAHAMNDNGLLRVLQGQSCIDAWKSPHLDAVQVPVADFSKLDHKYRNILENRDSNYRRDTQRGEKLALATVLAGDVSTPDGLGDDAASCWVKMGAPTLEGLRIAFLDPDDRVSLEPPAEPDWPRVERIRWEGGFLDGQEVTLSPHLNVLVGGRGTGKSTVIESLRFVFDREAHSRSSGKRHQDFVRDVLRSGSTVEVHLRSSGGARGTTYRVTRTVGQPASVQNAAGEPLDIDPAAMLGGLELFGQRELSAIARERTDQVRLLDRYLEDGSSFERTQEELRHRIRQNRRELENDEGVLSQLEEDQAQRTQLEEEKRRIEAAGLADKLKDKQRAIKEQQLFRSARQRVDAVGEAVRGLADVVPVDRAFVSSAALRGLPHAETLARLERVLGTLEVAIDGAVTSARRAQEAAEAEIDATERACKAGWDEVEERHQSTLRALQKEGLEVDGTELVGLERRLAELAALEPKMEAARAAVSARREERRKLLEDWDASREQHRERLERAAKKVARRLPDLVRATVQPRSNREELMGLVREHVNGRLDTFKKGLERCLDVSSRELAQVCREGADAIRSRFACSQAQSELLAGAGEPLWRDLEELHEPLEAEIELNVGDEKEQTKESYSPLDRLSDGQKATALLLIVLGDSSVPLVVDQPEDDLDNRFIVEGVVKRLRAAKQERQIVVASHNANIPVLGDCELLLPLGMKVEEGRSAGAFEVGAVGAIDDQKARGKVEELLEGGKRAFETRRERYGY